MDYPSPLILPPTEKSFLSVGYDGAQYRDLRGVATRLYRDVFCSRSHVTSLAETITPYAKPARPTSGSNPCLGGAAAGHLFEVVVFFGSMYCIRLS